MSCSLKLEREGQREQELGREPWSSGYGSRLTFKLLWIESQHRTNLHVILL